MVSLPENEVFVEDLTDEELHAYIGRCESELSALRDELTTRRAARLRNKRLGLLVCGVSLDDANETVCRQMWNEETAGKAAAV